MPQKNKTKLEVTGASSSGCARVKFNDGTVMVFIPYRNWGNIEGMDSVLLYQNGKLGALVVDRPYRYASFDESGFWSKEISQEEFARYWEAARDYTRNLGNEGSLWELKRILSEGWVYRGTVTEGKAKVFADLPGRFKNSIRLE